VRQAVGARAVPPTTQIAQKEIGVEAVRESDLTMTQLRLEQQQMQQAQGHRTMSSATE
jgi:hypothetical protein